MVCFIYDSKLHMLMFEIIRFSQTWVSGLTAVSECMLSFISESYYCLNKFDHVLCLFC